MKSITLKAFAAACVVGSITGSARAGGFAVAQFGGNHGNAASDSLTSIFYNPAGLALDVGTRIYVEALAAFHGAEYTRNAADIDNQNVSADAIAANSGKNTLGNFAASPFAAVASDLGVPGLGVAIGVYVPFGGSVDWDHLSQYAKNQMFPGAYDGPQRWSVVSASQQSIFYTVAAAYRTADKRLAFGGGLNVIQTGLKLTRARNITGTDDLLNGDGTIAEGRSLLDVSNVQASISLGLMAQLDDHTRVGVSYQSQPIGGEQKLDGTLLNQFGDAPRTQQDVEFRQRLPDSVRVAVEWREQRYAVRGGVDWTHWSVFQDQCLVDRTMASSCQFLPSGAFDPSAPGSAPLLDIPRRWNDTWGASIGGSWWQRPDLELSANLKLDTNAVPDTTLEPALMDATKLIGVLGARWTHGKVMIDGSLGAVGYQQRTTAPVAPLASPSRNPDMGGVYDQSIYFVLLGVGYKL